MKRCLSWTGQVLYAPVFLLLLVGSLAHVCGTGQYAPSGWAAEQERQVAARLAQLGWHYEDWPGASEADLDDEARPGCTMSPPLSSYAEYREASVAQRDGPRPR